ncbi:MAG: phage capsid protein [Pseudomonadota bacterium]
MADTSYKWYEDLISSQVRERNKVRGAYLDETMTTGDADQAAGVIRFPVISGSIEVVKVSGAIQNVQTSQATMDTVPITTDEYEAATYIKARDLRKQGPKEQMKVSKEVNKSINKKKDFLKLDALNAFANLGSTHLSLGPLSVETYGDGTAVIDPVHFRAMASRIYGTGAEEGLYWPIPEVWMDQLEMYKEWANADYRGDKDLPFARMDNVRKITKRGVHIFTLPDEYFKYGTGGYGSNATDHIPFTDTGYLDTFMWSKEAMGAQMDWFMGNVDVTKVKTLQGSPYLLKAGLDGAAIGVLPEQVKRIRMKAINEAVRPSV